MRQTHPLWRGGSYNAIRKIVAGLLAAPLLFSPLSVFAEESSAESAEAPIVSEPAVSPGVEPVVDAGPAQAEVDVSEEVMASSFSSTQENPSTRQQDTVGQSTSLTREEFTGTYNYSHKIELPPGRNAMTPSLSLTYQSLGHEPGSSVGYGWHFNIPAITRLNRHGSDKLYDYNDFSSTLSGELVQTGSTTYRAKVDNGEFLTYTFDNGYWTVYDKQGTRYLFGTSTLSRQDHIATSTRVYKWMLEEVRDTNNNYIKYEYAKSAGQIYPARIVYTGNGSTDGAFEVIFNRTAYDMAPAVYHADFSIDTNYRITDVEIRVGGQWVRKYELGITTGNAGYRRLLNSITETGRDTESGTTITRAPTQFTYAAGNTPGFTENSSTNWELPVVLSSSDVSNQLQIRDVNGDAYPDVIYADSTSCGGGQGVYINDTEGGWNQSNCGSGEWQVPVVIKDTSSTKDNGVRVFDVNGDLRNDLVRGYATTSGQTIDTSSVHLSSTSTPTWIASSTIAVPIGFVFDGTVHADNGTQVIDVNGDGLADILHAYGGSRRAYIGTGYGWEAATTTNWVTPHQLVTPNGISTDYSTFAQFADLNGDGLVDFFFRNDDLSEGSKIGINNGHGWDTYTSGIVFPLATHEGDLIASGRSDAGVRMLDVDGDDIPDIVRAVQAIDGARSTNSYISRDDYTWHSNYEHPTPTPEFAHDTSDRSAPTTITDINADGVDDILFANATSSTNVQTFLSNASPFTDLLSRVVSADGATTTISYKLSTKYVDGSGNLLNPSLPVAVTTVSSVSTTDGMGNTATENYTYANGHYYYNDPIDRTFAGFGLVTRSDAAGNVTKTYFHQGNTSATSTGEYQDHISKRGKPYRIEQYDGSNNLYSKIINKWDRADLGNNASFVKLIDTVDFTYDGDADHKDKATNYSYNDASGNISQQITYGEVTGSDDGTFSDIGTDKFTTSYSYATSTATSTLTKLSQETTVNQSAAKVREKRLYYDTLSLGSFNKGNPTKEEQWRTSTSYASTTKAYNSYGLPTSSTDPRAKTTTYLYDAYNLYPATTTNPLSQTILHRYDYSSGKIATTTDENSRVYVTVYDALDRPILEKQPDATTPTTLVPKRAYTYTDTGMPRRVQTTDYLDGSNSVDVYTYFDAQRKKVEDRTEAESGNYAVRDFTYDERGLLETESLPQFVSGTSYSGGTNPPTNSLITTYAYDPLRRVTSVTNTLGVITNSYDQWVATTTDAEGKIRSSAQDAYGNLVRITEDNGTLYTTSYEYNGNKNLTKVTDADGNIRNFTYDGLGRRLTAQDLHDAADATFGTWTYTYDDAGNLTQHVTPRSHTVTFSYDNISRVLTENWTGGSGTEVTYTYDTCGSGKGYICSASTTDARTTYTYTPLGQILTETKRITGTSATTTYTYDRQGNTTNIVYPDSSEVRYTYNSAGQLETIEQKENGGSFGYLVTDIDYNPIGKIAYKEFGNEVTSEYTYDPTKLYRITRILTLASTSQESLLGGGGGGELGFMSLEPYEYAYAMFLAFATTEQLADDLFAEEEVTGGEGETPSGAAQTTVPTEEPEDLTASPPITVEPDSSSAVGNLGTTTPSETTTPPTTIDEEGESMLPPLEGPVEATTTAPVLPEPLQKAFLTSKRPGQTMGAQGRMRVSEAGKTVEGYQLYRAQVYQKDVQYQDHETGVTDIDITLEDRGNAWVMEKAPFGARFGRNLNSSVITYRSENSEIYIAPLANGREGINGRVDRNAADGQFVVYNDAFAKGVDLEVSLDTDSLRKEAVIKDLQSTSSLTQRDGYVEIPFTLTGNEPIDIKIGGELVSKIGTTTTGEGVEVVGDSGHIAYFWSPTAVDSEGDSTPIEIEYRPTESGVEFVKLIPLSWLEKASYPVRTDTVVSYYADGGGDGAVWSSNGSWSNLRNESIGTHDNTAVTAYVESGWNGPDTQYRIRRIALPFDTSGLPDSIAIESALLKIRVISKDNGDNDGNDFIRVIQNTTASATTLADEDFDQFGAIDNPTAGASDVDIGSITAGNTWNTFTLNATGRSWINTTGYTKLGLREGHDVVDDPMSALTQNRVRFDTANTSGTTIDPVFEITYHTNVSPLEPTSLLTEGLTNPTNVTDSTPEFSAVVEDGDAGDLIVSYQIQVATSTAFTSNVWDSGKQTLASTTPVGMRIQDVSYVGSTTLASSTPYYWRIKFWDDDDFSGAWSTTTAQFSLDDGIPDIGPAIQDFNYGYDDVGNVIALTDSSDVGTAKIVIFGYDNLHRLTSASTTAASSTPFSHTYSYTPIGNLSSSTPSGSYVYAETGQTNPQAATSIGGVALTYDNTGNVTKYGSTYYTWNYANQLTGLGNGAATTTYGYDHLGQRVFKKLPAATTTVYVNDLYDTDGTTKTKHVFAGNELIATITTVGTTSTTQYLHADHLGSVTAVTNSLGQVVEATDYYPFGDERIATGLFEEQRKFIGQEYDAESDLNYLNARYYDADRGQFLSQDPVFRNLGVDPRSSQLLHDPQQLNSYNYARNNPIVYKDPQGELLFAALPIIFAVYGAASAYVTREELIYSTFYPEGYTAEERTSIRNQFAADLLTAGASRGLKNLSSKETLNILTGTLNTLDYYLGENIYEEANRNRAERNAVPAPSVPGSAPAGSTMQQQAKPAPSPTLSRAEVNNIQRKLNNLQKQVDKIKRQLRNRNRS